MMTAAQCRKQAKLYMDQARDEESVDVRTALLALNRSWITIANQIERLAQLRALVGRSD
jgi:hypothetical protein